MQRFYSKACNRSCSFNSLAARKSARLVAVAIPLPLALSPNHVHRYTQMFKTAATSNKQDAMELLLNAALATGKISTRSQQQVSLIDYPAYFKYCKVQKCQVVLKGKRSVSEIVTAVAGYLGGVNAALSFLCGVLLMKALSKGAETRQGAEARQGAETRQSPDGL